MSNTIAYKLLGAAAMIAQVSISTPLLAAPASGTPVLVGAILPMTGPVGPQGQAERRGAELAVKDINANGGIAGRPLQVLFNDDAANPDVSVSKANELINTEHVKAILGAGTAATTAAVGGVTTPLNMPEISIAGFNPKLEADRRCVYHMFAAIPVNAKAILGYAKAQGYKNVSMLHDSGYGAVTASLIGPMAANYGIKIVDFEKFDAAANDATAQAAKVKSTNPDAFFVVATSATPFRNLRQLQTTQPMIGAIGSSTYEYVKAMGVGANNLVFTDFVVAEDPAPYQTSFVNKYKAEYGALPKNFEASGWDGIQFLADALRSAGPDAEPKALCEALRKVQHGVMVEERDFGAPDMTGIAPKSFLFSKVDNGVYHRLDFRLSE